MRLLLIRPPIRICQSRLSVTWLMCFEHHPRQTGIWHALATIVQSGPGYMVENSNAKPRRRNTKERIIDEAEVLATMHGIEHLKLQDVADKIGIKLPSVYAHFSGREDILAAMGARINRAFSQLYHSKSDEDPVDALRKGTVELVNFLGEHPAYFRLMLRDLSVPLGYDPINRRFTNSHGNSIPPELVDMMSRIERLLQTAGNRCKPISAEDFTAALLGSLLVMFSWHDKPPPSEEEEKILDMETIRQQAMTVFSRMLGV